MGWEEVGRVFSRCNERKTREEKHGLGSERCPPRLYVCNGQSENGGSLYNYMYECLPREGSTVVLKVALL